MAEQVGERRTERQQKPLTLKPVICEYVFTRLTRPYLRRKFTRALRGSSHAHDGPRPLISSRALFVPGLVRAIRRLWNVRNISDEFTIYDRRPFSTLPPSLFIGSVWRAGWGAHERFVNIVEIVRHVAHTTFKCERSAVLKVLKWLDRLSI